MLLGFQTWSLKFFFCKLWIFLSFVDFSYQHHLEWGKLVIFKNNALKVECVPMIFENLNSFETMLKILKWCKYIKKIYNFLDFQCFSLFLDFSEKYQNMGQKLGSNKVYNLYVSFFFHEIWSGLEFVLLESLRMFICVLCFFWVLIHFHQVFLVLASLIFFGFGFFFWLIFRSNQCL
jgi:hypothetical protein